MRPFFNGIGPNTTLKMVGPFASAKGVPGNRSPKRAFGEGYSPKASFPISDIRVKRSIIVVAIGIFHPASMRTDNSLIGFYRY